jgi:ADP-heptose:LPS heptosyltransferase
MEKIILRHQRAPGDIVVMTAVVRDLALTYPGRFHIAVDTTFRELWLNNPHVKIMPDKRGARIVNLTYGSYIKKAATEKIHFLSSFHKDLKTQTGIDVPLLYPHPDIHLSEEEQKPIVSGRYWVVLAGGKNDFTTKHWVYERYQRVVDILKDFGIHVVQLGGRGSRPSHHHPKLNNVIDMVGMTNLRQMLRIINNSDGVICTITAAMHMAAALNKPCVVTGAGREEWWWEAYSRDNPGLAPVNNLLPVSHRYLHTIGNLDCCSKKGCWKNKVQKSEGDKSFCNYPTQAEGGQMVPLCMDMITAEKVVGSVLSYYMDGTLPLLEGMVLPDVTKPLVFTRDNTKYTLFVLSDGDAKPLSHKILEMPEESQKLQSFAKTAQENKPKDVKISEPPQILHENLDTAAEREKLDINSAQKMQTIENVYTNPAVSHNFVPKMVDAENIGGKVTFCVLMYGNFVEMHRRCLNAIRNTTTRENVELRVYCNNVSQETYQICEQMKKEGVIYKIYKSDQNKYKYPCMREMFHDDNDPITTKWVVWFDDDSMCDVDALWFDKMCSAVNSAAIADPSFGMLGPIYHFAMQPKHAEWVKKADWYRGKQFRDRSSKQAVNGNKIFFVTGSFWAMKTEAIKKANIPDVRLTHNGGDICIGEQMWQNGYTLKNWNGDKKIVCWSSTARRGTSQPIFNI